MRSADAANITECDPCVAFFVPGLAATQGSKVGAISKYPRKRDGKYFVVVKDCNRNLQQWRAAIAWHARQAYQGEPLDGPVRLELAFTLPRPKHHFKSGDTTRGLSATAPLWHTKKPDVSKLTRAVEDALTSLLWHDDAQVCSANATKRYGHPCGVHVKIRPIET